MEKPHSLLIRDHAEPDQLPAKSRMLRVDFKYRSMALLRLGNDCTRFATGPLSIPLRMSTARKWEKLNVVDMSQDIAKHEAGHLLINLLNGTPLLESWVNKFSSALSRCLGLPFGGYVSLPARSENGEKDKPVFLKASLKRFRYRYRLPLIDSFHFYQNLQRLLHGEAGADPGSEMGADAPLKEVAKKLLMILGGISAEQALHTAISSEEENSEMFTGSDMSEMNDICDQVRVKRILSQLLDGNIEDRNELESILSNLFHDLWTSLTEFFEDPAVGNLLQLLADEMFDAGLLHNGGQDLTPTIYAYLDEQGVSADDMTEITEKYNELVANTVGKLWSSLEF